MSDFGTILRSARATAGLTQQQVADAVGVNVQRISQLEMGRRPNPGWETVQRLADALGIPTDALRMRKRTAGKSLGERPKEAERVDELYDRLSSIEERITALSSATSRSRQGCNPQEAFENFKAALFSQFHILDRHAPNKLGPYLKKQITILRTYVRRTR